MIHVATVHWKTDRWVDVQRDFLKRYVRAPLRTYAFLDGLPERHLRKYSWSSSASGIRSHWVKLNRLAATILEQSVDDDDWLMFLDGDAFPIADLVAFAKPKLQQLPLLAIQRRENLGDVQPHPAFMLTTVGFWKALGGDWRPGPKWRNDAGWLVSDVGASLWSALNERNIQWHPLLRTNRRNLHRLFFGVYDDVIYHHGAGFRDPVTRFDVRYTDPLMSRLPTRIRRHLTPVMDRVIARRNARLQRRVFRAILDDPAFFRFFQTDPAAATPGASRGAVDRE